MMLHLWRVRRLPSGPWIYFECPPGAPVGPHKVAAEIIRKKNRELQTAPAQVRCVLPDGKQLKLHADEPEEEEAAAAEEADEGPALASVVEMHGNPKKKRSTAPLQ